MILFTRTITPRLQYITDFIGKEIIGKSFLLTDDQEEFKQYSGPRINYSQGRISDDEFWLSPHDILFETGVRQQNAVCFESNGQKAFFKTQGELDFDIFAASFYLLSRYEEYLPHQKDMYGRYSYKQSLAYNEKFLDKPLINIWLEVFKQRLKTKFPVSFTDASFRFLPTYDIDEAYSYKNKSLVRTAGGTVKAFLKGQFAKIKQRSRVLNDHEKDPYDSYEWMDELHTQYQLKARYFFLVAQHTGKYDKNILPQEKGMQELIRRHAEKYEIGIHPSWQSGDQPEMIRKEIHTLATISGKKIIASRQHYIRLSMPDTYRYLHDAGIQEDFSMGYGSINGFRASVASCFYWYDLDKDSATNLLIYPFCFMEANSFFEQNYSAEQALDEMRHYYRKVKSVNGLLVTLWHNTFLGTDPMFDGWKKIYKQFISEVMGEF